RLGMPENSPGPSPARRPGPRRSPAPPRRNRQPPGRAWTRRPRNFGRAKVGCYDETAVLKGVSVEPSVRLIPLGGLGEIGLNMMLIESGDDVIAVDCGLMFPDDELPGVDYVIPDFSYALAKR